MALDVRITPGIPPAIGSTEERDVLKLCAWAHGEWIRIHPFVNCNGSTARLWVTFLAARYGMPLVMVGKPRSSTPHTGPFRDITYTEAANFQMEGSDMSMQLWLEKELASIQQQLGLIP
jgi:hypothetical protein